MTKNNILDTDTNHSYQMLNLQASRAGRARCGTLSLACCWCTSRQRPSSRPSRRWPTAPSCCPWSWTYAHPPPGVLFERLTLFE